MYCIGNREIELFSCSHIVIGTAGSFGNKGAENSECICLPNQFSVAKSKKKKKKYQDKFVNILNNGRQSLFHCIHLPKNQ